MFSGISAISLSERKIKIVADYKDKIRKLLALAESPNENEVRAALLKARALMAEHKMNQTDIHGIDSTAVDNILTDITCSKRRDPWKITLATVISENYCCRAFRKHRYRGQTQIIGFVGFKDDVTLCMEIYKYAVDCVMYEIKRIIRRNKDYSSNYVKRCCDSFGYGFVYGLYSAFKKQSEEKREWGLVLVIPQEVNNAADKIGKPSSFHSSSENSLFVEEFGDGYEQGKKFNMHRRLKENM